jgi:hypothetical protein
MIKASGTGKHGEPVLVLAFNRQDVDVRLGNTTLVTTLRSKSGVEANIILALIDDDAAWKAKLGDEFGSEIAVTYAGPMLDGGEVIRTS